MKYAEPFADDLSTCLFLISGIHINFKRRVEGLLTTQGLTFTQYGVLSVVAAQPGLTQRDIAARLDTDTTTVAVVCEALEKKGHITRETDPQDRRAKQVVLTPSGKRTVSGAQRRVERDRGLLTQAIEMEALERTLPLLRSLYVYLREER